MYKGVQIWSTLWFDTKPVNLLHTIGSPASYSGTAMRWVKNTAASGFKRVTYWCPSAYIIYNQMMGGVDTFDHYRAMYTVSLIVKNRGGPCISSCGLWKPQSAAHTSYTNQSLGASASDNDP